MVNKQEYKSLWLFPQILYEAQTNLIMTWFGYPQHHKRWWTEAITATYHKRTHQVPSSNLNSNELSKPNTTLSPGFQAFAAMLSSEKLIPEELPRLWKTWSGKGYSRRIRSSSSKLNSIKLMSINVLSNVIWALINEGNVCWSYESLEKPFFKLGKYFTVTNHFNASSLTTHLVSYAWHLHQFQW